MEGDRQGERSVLSATGELSTPARSTGADSRTAVWKHREFEQPGHEFKMFLSVVYTETQRSIMDN